MVLSMSSQDDLRPRYPMSRRAFVNSAFHISKACPPTYKVFGEDTSGSYLPNHGSALGRHL